MGLADIFKRGPKKARPVGQSLEKGRDDSQRQHQVNVLVKVGIFVLLLVLTMIAFPRSEVYTYVAQVGDVWREETLAAPFDFPVLKDGRSLAAERSQARRDTPPYFREISDAQDIMRTRRDTISNGLEQVFSLYASFQMKASRGRTDEARLDSLAFVQARSNALLPATDAQWDLMLDSYMSRLPGAATVSRVAPSGPRLDEQLVREAWAIGTQMLTLTVGVLDVPADSVVTPQLVIRNLQGSTPTQRTVDKENVFGLDEAFDIAQERFARSYPDNPDLENLVGSFFSLIFQPSLTYLRAETEQERARRAAEILPNRGIVRQNEVIIRKGDLVTEEIERKVISLERSQTDRTGDRLPWKIFLGQFILVFSTYSIFFLYLFLLRRKIFDDNRKVLLVALLFAVMIWLFAIALRLPVIAILAVPVTIVSILLTVMFDSRVGFFATMALALLGSHLLHFDFVFTFATLFAGALGIFSVRDIKNRGQLFVSVGLIVLGYLTVMGATWLVLGTRLERITWDLLFIGINAVLILLAYPLLWVFERAFNVTTDLTLLELSDTNRPLLKELSMRAPGTFNHVLQVANLAEAAADAIGANALLTRVGALYHDVGKMLKPEYFVENQRPGNNPHDQLKPRMSALIIASHVKEGLEIARAYKLPQPVLDFIPMHHGSTRIEYFYKRALELHRDEDPPILESEFRYPGPKPTSKETGILMLADSVEAASRTLGNPSHKRLESLIDMIFEARRVDGQLANTDLTFHDMTLIKETFLTMLMGIYHVRVKYPDQEAREKEEAALEAKEAVVSASATPVGLPAEDEHDSEFPATQQIE